MTGVVPQYRPMLAMTGAPARRGEWVAEPKLDGWRAQVAVCGTLPDGARVTTRSGRVLDRPINGLAAVAACGLRVVLDGELVAGDGSSSSFYSVAGALARRTPSASVSFVAFDVLWFDGHDVTGLADRQRRALLEDLDLPGVHHPPRFAADDVDVILDVCEQLGVEGVVLKRLDAPYRPGVRSPDWRKAKTSTWRARHAAARTPARR